LSLATIILGLALACAIVVLLQVIIQLVELCIAAQALLSDPSEPEPTLVWRRSADAAPPISVIAPAFNEEANIVESVRSLLGLRYPQFEVIVVSDGSTDATINRLAGAFDLRRVSRDFEAVVDHEEIQCVYRSTINPNLTVIDKTNGGKADALNAGLNAARHPLFCCVDADSVLEFDALLRIVQPFVDDPLHVVASGGSVCVANGCAIQGGRVVSVGLSRNPLALMQTVEYLRAFQLARLAWSRIDALAIISGAFGLFRRDVVMSAGGYRRETVGEDIELVVRLHRQSIENGLGHRVVFVPDPVCWTEAPETMHTLARQRTRWQRGALETLFEHRRMLTTGAYGRVGRLALGRLLLVDLIGPLAEMIGWFLLAILWGCGLLAPQQFFALFSLTVALGFAISITAIALQPIELSRARSAGDVAVMAAAALAENFGYRQLMGFWRFRGLLQWLRRDSAWGAMTRRGLAAL
jgi:cellulose synthase/poly-beta-1,6-N-acetylglucosamine synthase-like glycosyltransferase